MWNRLVYCICKEDRQPDGVYHTENVLVIIINKTKNDPYATKKGAFAMPVEDELMNLTKIGSRDAKEIVMYQLFSLGNEESLEISHESRVVKLLAKKLDASSNFRTLYSPPDAIYGAKHRSLPLIQYPKIVKWKREEYRFTTSSSPKAQTTWQWKHNAFRIPQDQICKDYSA